MTDKELKKLSRLELLEILLEETKENEKLREELEKSKRFSQSNSVLLNLIDRLNNTLNRADRVADKLYEASENITDSSEQHRQAPVIKTVPSSQALSDSSKPVKQTKGIDKSLITSDLKLYLHILNFYLNNDSALSALPPDIQNDIRTRIRGILDAKKQRTLD